MNHRYLVAVLLVLASATALSQTTYYSQGSLPPDDVSSWNSAEDGSGSNPTDFTTGDLFIIRSGHGMSTSATWTVSGSNAVIRVMSGGSLTAANDLTTEKLVVQSNGTVWVNAGVTVTVNDGNGAGTDLIVNGTLSNSGSIVYGSGATGEVGGTYWHTQDGGAIPVCSWDSYSLTGITGITTTAPVGLNQAFGYFRYNCTSQTAAVEFNSALTSIARYFWMESTGSGSLVLFNSSANLTVGEWIQDGGTIDFSTTAAITSTVTISQTGVNKNYLTQNGGTIQTTGSGSTGTFVFTDASNYKETDLYTVGVVGAGIGYQVQPNAYVLLNSNVTVTADFAIDSAAFVDTWPDNHILAGTGSFTLKSAGSLSINHAEGITTAGATGQVQVSGSRTYDAGAKYYYWGAAEMTALVHPANPAGEKSAMRDRGRRGAGRSGVQPQDGARHFQIQGIQNAQEAIQVTGGGLPVSLTGYLEIWPDVRVTLSQNTEVRGNIKLGGGEFKIGANTLTLSGSIDTTGSGYFISDAVGTVAYSDTANGQPVIGRNSQYGNLALSGGSKNAANKGFRVAGDLTNTSTPVAASEAASVLFNGSGTQSAARFPFLDLTIDKPTGSVNLTGSITVLGSLSFVNGRIVTDTCFVEMQNGNPALGADSARYVEGKMKRPTLGDNADVPFEVGDAYAYAPVTIKLPTGYIVGTIWASTTAGEHPNSGGSKLDTSRSVNRYWTVQNEYGYNGPYEATVVYPSTDRDPGVPDSVLRLLIYNPGMGDYGGAPWMAMAAAGVTSTSMHGTANTASFGDLAVGAPQWLTIAGFTSVSGVTQLLFTDTTAKAVDSSPSGTYSFDVSLGWSGTVTPIRPDLPVRFTPGSKSYSNITSDQTWQIFSATFIFTITPGAGDNGTVTPSSPVIVPWDSSYHFTIVPNEGYQVDGLLVDGVPVDSTISYTFFNVREEHSIAATFKPALVPVQLTSLVGAASFRSVELQWRTASETQNAGFEVQRMTNGEWKNVGFVPGAGTSSSEHSYRYAETAAAAGRYVYRLRQVDKLGNSSLSQSVEVAVSMAPEDYRLSENFPNPFNPATKMNFAVQRAERVTVRIYNLMGQEVATLFDDVAQPEQLYTLSFDGRNIASGMYMAVLKSPSRFDVRKIVLLK